MMELKLNFGVPAGATVDEISAVLDRVQDALCDIDRYDIIFGAAITPRKMHFVMGEDDDGAYPSLDNFLADVRTALHAAGFGTAGWEELSAELSGTVPLGLVSA